MSTSNLPMPVLAEKLQTASATQGASIYFAAPKSQRDTPRYRQLLAHLRALFPDARIIEGLAAFRDTAHWRATWPAVLASLSVLVFIADGDGWIGRGVWVEVQQARTRVPVYLLTDDGQLVPLARVSCSAPRPDNWTSHVQVRAGQED